MICFLIKIRIIIPSLYSEGVMLLLLHSGECDIVSRGAQPQLIFTDMHCKMSLVYCTITTADCSLHLEEY